ncbi:alginate export family protein [Novosphingobium sp.]|uniref:alginate export family protein n=1 Tax=Novosphingobium sp. TaxID=1874826 RepID=UPI002626064D|nr:alginate export family protein [Novosphingobium sp.]
MNPLVFRPRHRGMLTAAAMIAASGFAAPAAAEEVTIRPLIDIRLQIETLDVDSLPEPSEAATVRLRTGAEGTAGRFTARVEGQANVALVDNYADGLNGLTDRPVIPDPENLALYQAYLRYTAPGVMATVGRQEIDLDDARFIGTAPIRQNAQNFDALRVRWTGVKNLTVDVSYAWSFRPFWGRDGFGSRPEEVDGDNIFVNIAAKTGIGTLTGFAYVVDLDDPRAQSFRLSSQTYGVRLTGTKKLKDGLGFAYLASVARQSDSGRNPNDYTADFAALEGTAIVGAWRLGGGFEILGADDGTAFASFQTPFSSGVKFLGLAGRFLPTPADGVRDYYGMVHTQPGKVGPLADVNLKAVVHHFTSDRALRVYGNELDLLASGKLGATLLTLRYADYREAGFSADTQRFMLQLDWRY